MKIYSPPAELPQPKLDYSVADFRAEMAKEEDWVKIIKEWAYKHGKGPLRGKEVRFPVADGYARYVVLSGSELIHLPVGDSYQFQYAHRLTAADLKAEVRRDEAWAKIVKRHREERAAA